MLEALLHAHGRTSPVERSTLHTAPAAAAAAAPTREIAAPARRGGRSVAAWAIAGAVIAGIAGFAILSQRTSSTTPAAVSQPEPASRPIEPAPAPVAAVPQTAPAPSIPAVVPPPSPPENKGLARAIVPKPPAGRGRAAGPESTASVAPPLAPASAPEIRTVPATPPPAVAPAASPEPKAAPIEPPPAPAVAVSPPPPPQPAPPPARAEENPVTAIQAVLARYRAALESRDINALKRIWPTLSGRQEDAIRSEFEHSRSIAVGIDSVDIRPNGNGATVSCHRNYAVTTADGQTLRTATQMSMTLARHDGVWTIETIRHETTR
jgi:hypothetical protein